ncbi:MAG: acyl-CoA carboxylase subunit epsilon [Micromonosporaceae bacterium]
MDVDEPLVRVVRGRPTPEELAALVTVLCGRRAEAAAPAPVSRWARSTRAGAGSRDGALMRLRGPSGWRDSARPHRG